MISAAALLALTMLVPDQAAQESLSAARDLYASAAYEDALAVLNRLPNNNRAAEEVRAIDQYRAFCLLALGRTSEAEHAIEAVVSGEPTYQPAGEVSPRVRAAFSDVRKRMLPAIIQQQYAIAKAAYDRKEFAAAAAGFARVLAVMADPAAATAVSQPPLADLRTLAAGFRDLSTSAATPPPLPTAVAMAAAVVPPPPPPPPAPPRVYSPMDVNVVPPLAVHQELPPFQGQPLMSKQGLIEILIDETGIVEAAQMRESVSVQYDNQALAAARTWRYRPATVDGVPVKFKKTISITVKGRS
jgi:TonB family protein